MNKRKVFLLFLSAMSVSIVVMIIVYGLFIKDLNFSFNVKNPDIAPSPLEGEEGGVDDEYRTRARIMSPEEMARQEEAKKTQEKEDDDPDAAPAEEEVPEVTEVTPLAAPSVEAEPVNTAPAPENQDSTGLPTLHFVYLDGFSSRDSAEQALGQLQGRSLVARPYIRQHNGQVILQFGVFSDRENADAMAQQLRNQQVFVKVD